MKSYYNKLVRDKIPEIIRESGKTPNIRILSDEEYITFLNHKLREECNEYHEKNSIEELADIQEVINAIIKFKGYDFDKFEKIRLEKLLKNGGFQDKILLDNVED